MSVSDNFDYSIPTLKRNNTMYLSCINSKDAKMGPFKKLCTQRDWSTNLYNLDIESSMPRTFGVFLNKVDFINKLDDIEKSNPKILHYPLNKPEYNLYNKDIEKSSPDVNQFKSKRCTNPLEPKYKLSKLEDYPLEIPKFIKDSMDISDIQGASPSKKNFIKIKDNTEKTNIEGSKTKIPYYRRNLGKIKYHYLDYSDLNSYIFKTKRHINALDPIYIFKNKDKNEFYHYGHIEKSKPQVQYPFYYKPPLNLKLDDIKGSNPGSKNYINKFNGKNYEMYNGDIEKSGAGSLKKGITTKRCINPLMPKYQYLGETELKDSFFNINKTKKRSESVPKMISNKQCFNNNIKIIPNDSLININNKKDNDETNKDNKGIGKENSNNNKSNNDKDINNNKSPINEDNKDNKDNKIINKNYSVNNISNSNNKINNNENEKNLKRTPLLGCSHKGINTSFQIDKTKYGIKPKPFYGFTHEPFLLSSENKDHLDEIEKKKQEKEIKKKANSRNNNENDNKTLLNEYIKNPNEDNLLFMSDNNLYQNQNKTFNQNKTVRVFNNKNILRTNNQLYGIKKSYEEQLDSYLNNTINQKFY